ncbi:MAG: hypothetical protein OWR52_09185 [Acidibacillus sp.]|uniref:Uncharacterized protein n=1 Tax=Sulfoacidibacillus ferrooxidans TaxID=2005001 RepID=A0A9X2AF83_9BACL|nr:hypothetical protein [Sulfoacidibacillus ferrooxidans]MCI0183806.1 hypothetical protein [Sulfoacidibacillus ferrooxidans]MCY0893667.1 hypothetical protein [Acidibacillus sp.]
MSLDAELFILSYAKIETALLFTPQNERYISAKREIEKKLEQEYHITQLQVMARSVDLYTVAYKEQDEQKIISFPADEVEDFD